MLALATLLAITLSGVVVQAVVGVELGVILWGVTIILLLVEEQAIATSSLAAAVATIIAATTVVAVIMPRVITMLPIIVAAALWEAFLFVTMATTNLLDHNQTLAATTVIRMLGCGVAAMADLGVLVAAVVAAVMQVEEAAALAAVQEEVLQIA